MPTLYSFAQAPPTYIRGVVLEDAGTGQFTPLVGATIVWLGTTHGTSTDSTGVFKLKLPENSMQEYPTLIISYLGYKSDTISVKNTEIVRVILAEKNAKTLQEIEITERINSTYISALDPLNTKTMTEKELFKAACCNLSESFETNPSVDVLFTDAISGAKQIQMLGLSGLYTQLNYENMPGSRGLAGNYGLGYTPGAWIESIQVTKGVGSVANGYESMAGQINVELKKTDITPKTGEKVFFNAYSNNMGRYEGTLNLTQKLSSKWSSATLLHANGLNNKVDMNHDNFLDVPLGYQLNAMQRWKFEHKNLLVQLGVKALRDERLGGQYQLSHLHGSTTPGLYQIRLNTERIEGFAKIGYIFPEKKYKSIGLIISALQHYQLNEWGLENIARSYSARQQNVYSNLIYQSIIGNTNHKYRVGAGFMLDEYNENLSQLSLKRKEMVPGAFGEYTWTSIPRLTLILGLRADYHSIFGSFITPRVHGKYDISENTSVRISAGRGQRTANLIADNFSYLISNRNALFPQNSLAEVSWNYGISYTHEFRFNNRKGAFTTDFYRTDFEKQLVLDVDKNAQELNLYALQGLSFSNSLQTELNYELLKRLDMRMTYRYYDVQTTYSGRLLERPFISKHRAFANVAYETRSHWRFDVTLNWNGRKRIPNTLGNPTEYQFPEYSPNYFIVNAQMAKSFGDPANTWWDVYIGAENLGNFRQEWLINSPENPSSPYFDAAMVWGPVIGRMFYAGVRYKIK